MNLLFWLTLAASKGSRRFWGFLFLIVVVFILYVKLSG